MTTYRITQTTLRGQFANDACWVKWIQAQPSETARVVDWYEDPAVGSDGTSPNDRRLYLWAQDKDVKGLVCPHGQPDLLTDAGKNGWPTEAEARAVLNKRLKIATQIEEQVAAANAKAISPGHLIESAADDAAKVGAAVVESAKSPWTKLFVGGLIAVAAIWGVSRVVGR